jgi:hypothetical protein
MRALFAFPLLVSVLLSLTEVVVAEETRIFSAILPIPPQHVTGPGVRLLCNRRCTPFCSIGDPSSRSRRIRKGSLSILDLFLWLLRHAR